MSGREWIPLATLGGAGAICYAMLHRAEVIDRGASIAQTATAVQPTVAMIKAAQTAVHVAYGNLSPPARLASTGLLTAVDGFADGVCGLDAPPFSLAFLCHDFCKKAVDAMIGAEGGSDKGSQWIEPYLLAVGTFEKSISHALSLPGLLEAADKGLDRTFGSKQAKWAFYIGAIVLGLVILVGYLGIFTPLGGMALAARR